MERNRDDIFDSLHQYFLSIGLKKKRKNFFIKEFEDGYWYINRLSESGRNVIRTSYQIGFHLYEAEKTAAELMHEKYSRNAITGTCNLGYLFNSPIYYEQLIDPYITGEDILFDVSYHIDRYVISLFDKYDNLNSFLNAIVHSDEFNNFNIDPFSNAALHILAHDFEGAIEIIERAKRLFKDEDEKNSCISKIKSME